MKLIHKFKSPNFNKRKSNSIRYIIIHYTALPNIQESINYLCDPNNKVSAHFLINKQGEIYSLVDEKNRAWHAGQSYWEGNIDINSISIGIELDYLPTNKNKYSNEMIISLRKLLLTLVNKYKIKKNNILAHSDIAPYRKIDPGIKFPWDKIILKKITFKNKIKKINFCSSTLFKWFNKVNIITKKNRILFMLAYIGYDTKPSITDNMCFTSLIKAYQIHYNQKKVSGKIDKTTYRLITYHFINKVLNF